MKKFCENCGKEFGQKQDRKRAKFCCKKCQKKKYYKDNKKAIIEKAQNWSKENKEKTIGYKKKYYRENKEKFKEQSETWAQKNKDKVKEKHKRFAKKHPEKMRAKRHKRRARKKGNGGSFTAEQLMELRKKSEGICIGFKRELHFVGVDKLEIDHEIALANGGSNNIENIQLLCKSCNCRKGVK